MSFERTFESNEQVPVPRVTLEEFEEIRSVPREVAYSPEFKQRLEDLGLPYNAGEVLINVEGVELSIITNPDDYGTVGVAPGNVESVRALEDLGLKTGVSPEVEAWLDPVDEKLVREIEAEERADVIRGKVLDGIKEYFGFRK